MWNGLKQHFCRDLCKFTFLGGFAFHGSTSARVQTRPTHHVACGNASLHPRVRRSGTLFSCEPEEERLTHVERRNAKRPSRARATLAILKMKENHQDRIET